MAEIAVGIDLGTSNSCVAVARGKRVEVLPNAYGEHVTASVVNFAENGSVVVRGLRFCRYLSSGSRSSGASTFGSSRGCLAGHMRPKTIAEPRRRAAYRA